MKNSQKGFVGIAALIIVGVLVVGGGTYIYLNTYQRQNNSLAVSETSAVTDFKDIKDFGTCMSYARNMPTIFDIVFTHGSDIQEVRNFSADFKGAYPRAELKVSNEQDFLNEAIAYNEGSIKTAGAMEEYKKMIRGQATSKISVKVPIRDLGSWQDFSKFMSETLNKYVHIKFQQYAGSSPETTLSVSVAVMQKSAEKQCDFTYKKLRASDRASLDVKNADVKIQSLISGSNVSALTYYGDHNSYAPGSLALNSGICSDTGVYGLKKTVDSIREIAGEVYCYASSKTFAISAPLKSTPTIGYCADSTAFRGAPDSPTAASKGYCVTPPQKISQDISACKNAGTARERWICVGKMVDPFPSRINNIVMPYATPVSQKIDYCKTYTGIEADYCFSSIVKAGWGLNVGGSPDASAVCKMVSNKTPWFKTDCENKE